MPYIRDTVFRDKTLLVLGRSANVSWLHLQGRSVSKTSKPLCCLPDCMFAQLSLAIMRRQFIPLRSFRLRLDYTHSVTAQKVVLSTISAVRAAGPTNVMILWNSRGVFHTLLKWEMHSDAHERVIFIL
jgi:hypothetical protein